MLETSYLFIITYRRSCIGTVTCWDIFDSCEEFKKLQADEAVLHIELNATDQKTGRQHLLTRFTR